MMILFMNSCKEKYDYVEFPCNLEYIGDLSPNTNCECPDSSVELFQTCLPNRNNYYFAIDSNCICAYDSVLIKFDPKYKRRFEIHTQKFDGEGI